MGKCCKKDTVKVEFTNIIVNKSKNYISSLPPTVIETIREFDINKKLKGCSEATRRNYIRILMQFARESNKKYDDITRKDIDRFLAKRDCSTLEHYKLVIKDFFIWFKKAEMVQDLRYNDLPETLTLDMMWTDEEYLSLLKVVDPHTKEGDQAILMMLWDLAVEKSCIENLKIGDIFEQGNKHMVKLKGKRRGKIKEFVLECIYSAPFFI